MTNNLKDDTMEHEQPIRDKWEAEIRCMDLQRKAFALDEILRQQMATQQEINKLTDKLNMHRRDAEYVATALANSLPPMVIGIVKAT